MSEFAKPIKRRDFLRIAWMLLVSGVATTCSSKPITQGPTTAVATAIKKASTPFPQQLEKTPFITTTVSATPFHQPATNIPGPTQTSLSPEQEERLLIERVNNFTVSKCEVPKEERTRLLEVYEELTKKNGWNQGSLEHLKYSLNSYSARRLKDLMLLSPEEHASNQIDYARDYLLKSIMFFLVYRVGRASEKADDENLHNIMRFYQQQVLDKTPSSVLADFSKHFWSLDGEMTGNFKPLDEQKTLEMLVWAEKVFRELSGSPAATLYKGEGSSSGDFMPGKQGKYALLYNLSDLSAEFNTDLQHPGSGRPTERTGKILAHAQGKDYLDRPAHSIFGISPFFFWPHENAEQPPRFPVLDLVPAGKTKEGNLANSKTHITYYQEQTLSIGSDYYGYDWSTFMEESLPVMYKQMQENGGTYCLKTSTGKMAQLVSFAPATLMGFGDQEVVVRDIKNFQDDLPKLPLKDLLVTVSDMRWKMEFLGLGPESLSILKEQLKESAVRDMIGWAQYEKQWVILFGEKSNGSYSVLVFRAEPLGEDVQRLRQVKLTDISEATFDQKPDFFR